MSYDIKERAYRVMERMLENNPFASPVFKPFIYTDAISQENMLGSEKIDLTKIYSDVCEGDIAYGVFRICPIYDKKIYLSIRDDSALFVNGEMIFDGSGSGEYKFFDVQAKADGTTEIMLRSICRDGQFGFEYSLTTPEYKYMWTKDYSFCMRKGLPIDEFIGEEGIAFSRKFSKEESDKAEEFERGRREFVFPKRTEKCVFKSFGKLYDSEKGEFAYAVTYAKESAKLTFTARSLIRIFVNSAAKVILKKGESAEIAVNKGDEILVKAVRTDGEWGFDCDDEKLCIPFLVTKRKNSATWLMIGCFGNRGDPIERIFAPEEKMEYKKPYQNSEKEEVYFRFPDGKTYLRPYQNTAFCGQWYYAVMCGHFGLAKFAQTFNDERCMDYFYNSMKIMADFCEYAGYDKCMFKNDTSMLIRSSELDILDNIGTMGMNAADAYLIKSDDSMRALVFYLADALNNVPCFENGVFHRKNTMWADDLFMSVPFLLRLWRITKNMRYLDKAAKQLIEYKKLMYMEDKNIFSHIYFIKKEKASRVPWGRGNGWVMIALSEFLEYAPKEHACYEKIKNIFILMSGGIRKLQTKSGAWNNVLDSESSYGEASCTVMFLYAFSKGIRNNILDSSYKISAENAWKALCDTFLDEEGNLSGICSGSGCSDDPKYYDSLNTITNDEHGTGMLLAAACEYYKLIN